MKFSAPWTATVAAAALMALPGAVAAQNPPPSTQPPATTQPATPPAESQAPAATQGSAQEHLTQAKTTLNEIGTANLPARARTHVAELKKRIATLERMAAAGNTGAVTATQSASKTRVGRTTANWGIEVAAMDKIVTSLLGISPTGTSGTTSTKPAAPVTLDEATRTKLTEFRTHLTAFATAMSSQPGGGDTPAPAAAASATAPDPAAQPAPATPAQTQPTTPKADAAAAKQHLTEVRNTLSQLTQLPAAAQLTGDARTQITQLISNFNELITTQSNWPAAYAKVSANLTALLGPDAPASGTEGAIGTSGAAATLDPAVREKLVEMRKHLVGFERASGGTPAPAAAPETAPAAPKSAEPRTPPADPATPAAAPAPAPVAAPAAAAGDALTRIAAIEAMLKSQNESGGMTLDKAQVELLRTHIAELRKLLEKK